jgi:hypothetical protein
MATKRTKTKRTYKHYVPIVAGYIIKRIELVKTVFIM